MTRLKMKFYPLINFRFKRPKFGKNTLKISDNNDNKTERLHSLSITTLSYRVKYGNWSSLASKIT